MSGVVFHLVAANGATCRVDYDDWVYFNEWKWKTKRSKRSTKLYFFRTPGSRNGVHRTIYLHIEIMKRKQMMPRRRRIVDHVNGDSLDCRRENLRWVTHKQNMINMNVWQLDEHGCSDRFIP